MIYPAPLRPGDTIGIVSPSYPVTAEAPESVRKAVKFLQSRGYRIKLGRLTGKKNFYRSGGIRERAEELNEMFRDPQVRCVMAAMGGFVTNAALPYLDYAALRRDPKIIVGHSDITALLLGVSSCAGIVSFHGPNLVPDFRQPDWAAEFSLHSLQEAVSGACRYELPSFYCKSPPCWDEDGWKAEKTPNRLLTVRAGCAEGRLIGGNLNSMTGILGTPYMPAFEEGDILFLEDTQEDAAFAERYFSTLKLAGILEKAAGILLAKHRDFNSMGAGCGPADILLEVLGDRHIPILAEFDSGHTAPCQTLPIGGMVRLDAGRQAVFSLPGNRSGDKKLDE